MMTHKPAVPPGSTPPYPAHPAPYAESIQAEPPLPDVDEDESEDKPSPSVGLMGAAVGIGSAAIVAALLYVRHKRA
jgi:hypothetical protein